MATLRLPISGMDCASCARTIEQGIRTLDGVQDASVQFAASTLHVEYDAGKTGEPAIAGRVESLGYHVGEEAGHHRDHHHEADGRGPLSIAFLRYFVSRREYPLWAGFGLLAIGLIVEFAGGPSIIGSLFEAVALIAAGAPIAWKGLRSFWFTRRVGVDLLIAIAGAGAFAIGETAEAAVLVVLYALGEALEGFTAQRSREALRALLDLTPAEATVVGTFCDHGDGCTICQTTTRTLPVADVAAGSIVRVIPGERIPLDGEVVRGATAINQAAITGESVPVEKQVGDDVFAATINGDGAIDIRVSAVAGESLLSRIAHLVDQAQSERSPVERVVDRFAAIYTPAVIVLAALVAAVPPLLLGLPFFETATDVGWLYRALSILVIACPCALVLSTPTTIVSGLVAAARKGILVKNAAALEAIGQVRAIAFDKTGTLTIGQPQVQDVVCATPHAGEDCDNCDDLLALAAAVERQSAHPIARAVASAATTRSVATRYPDAATVTNLVGKGISGDVAGHTVTVGSHSYFDLEHGHAETLCDAVEGAETGGKTVLLVCSCEPDHAVRGFISVADSPRAVSGQVIRDLRGLGIEETVLLTGDNKAVGNAIGGVVGVDTVAAGLLPADKLTHVRSLQAAHGRVAMIGDGINDAPALAAADVGIAMGAAGSAQAIESADIALLGDDLTKLPFLVRLSRQTSAIIKQNVAFSIALKLIFLVLIVGGFSNLWAAVLADVGGALLVTLNGMRLLNLADRT